MSARSDSEKGVDLLQSYQMTKLRTQYDKSKRPNKHTARVAWNTHFERGLSLKYDRFEYSSAFFDQEPDTLLLAKTFDIGDLNQSIALLTKEIVRCQEELIGFAMENLVYGTFEADWKRLDLKKKKELVLEGLYRGACAAPRDNSRISCPEMTIDGLVGDTEYNLISLLKCIIDHSSSGHGHVTTPFLFVHPYTENELQLSASCPENIKAFVYDALLLRNFYMTETLVGILQAYHNQPARQVRPAKLYDAFPGLGRGLKQNFPECGKDVDRSQEKEEAAIAVYACFSCNKAKTERSELMRCARCRLVWYCSKTCQKKDWTDHKKYCGKRQFDPSVFMPTPDADFIGCPEAAPGFQRSPALWRQIRCLSKPDSLTRDYHFRIKYDHTRSLQLADPWRLAFLVARRRAFASGSPSAVYAMYSILELCQRAGLVNLTLEQMRRQFEIEYGLSLAPDLITSGIQSFASPTKQEMDEEISYLLQRAALETPTE
ncbi:hypothetical protein C8R43DRAFT_1230303 [Mycena crocata]|nr:hypothetical protein C8R43DRAFT_1230303 [Mycena crocata]